MNKADIHFAKMPDLEYPAFLTDRDVAEILVLTSDWVRTHANDIPGFRRLGSYFRFCRQSVEEWLGGLDSLFVAEQVAALARVPKSWVYANADEIPGVLRLGHYVRFRPKMIRLFLIGSDVGQ